jgi:proteic killer suppression protein
MEISFATPELDNLETDPSAGKEHSQGVVKAYRKRLQAIRAAVDRRDFYAMKSLHFEKLQGDRDGQYSMRLNDQWRLILTIDDSDRAVTILSIEDYH